MATVSKRLFPIEGTEQGRALDSTPSKEAIIYQWNQENSRSKVSIIH